MLGLAHEVAKAVRRPTGCRDSWVRNHGLKLPGERAPARWWNTRRTC